MAIAARKTVSEAPKKRPQASRKVIVDNFANEIVFGILGHVGSGNTTVAETLSDVLKATTSGGQKFEVAIIKARTVIEESMKNLGRPIATTKGKKLITDDTGKCYPNQQGPFWTSFFLCRRRYL
jgi:hypothetical protein